MQKHSETRSERAAEQDSSYSIAEVATLMGLSNRTVTEPTQSSDGGRIDSAQGETFCVDNDATISNILRTKAECSLVHEKHGEPWA